MSLVVAQQLQQQQALRTMSSQATRSYKFEGFERHNHYQHRRAMMTTHCDVPFEGVSEEVSKIIYDHAHQPQTSVSLQALMRTGRGEFLHRTFDHVAENNQADTHSATELVLIQVRIFPNFLKKNLCSRTVPMNVSPSVDWSRAISVF